MRLLRDHRLRLTVPDRRLLMSAPQQALLIGGGGGGAVGSTITWDSADKTAGWTLSEGDVRATNSGGGLQNIRSIDPWSLPDKRVFALEFINHGAGSYCGINDETEPIGTINERYWVRQKNGTFFNDATGGASSGPALANGDILVFAVDHTARKLWQAVNNVTWLASGDPAAGTNPYITMGGTWEFRALLQDTNSNMDVRILSGATFPYAIPSGFT